jgi:long-chain acyl-CoA synthetase
MNQQGKHDGLFGFELAKTLMLWPESFQVIGIVTSTMKLQRHQAKKVFLK